MHIFHNQQVLRIFTRTGNREITEKDEASASYVLACLLRDQGRLPEAERLLAEFVNQFRGMKARAAVPQL